jgi:hypothetical protein
MNSQQNLSLPWNALQQLLSKATFLNLFRSYFPLSVPVALFSSAASRSTAAAVRAI